MAALLDLSTLPPGFEMVLAGVLGACLGSFLNALIHRLPRGLSLHEPRRSFCPHCQTTLRWWNNLPLFSYLWQRGRCAACQAPIGARYFWVELLMAGLFVLAARWFEPWPEWVLAAALLTLLVAISGIDAEWQLIPLSLTWGGGLLALAGATLSPATLHLARGGDGGGMLGSLAWALAGGALGFGGLWLVVELGKKVFGRRELCFDSPVPWALREPRDEEEQLTFVVGGEALSWGELFARPSDRLLVESSKLRVDHREVTSGEVRISPEAVQCGSKTWTIEELRALSGVTSRVIIPREAMGSGDPHLLGMIGLFLGPWAVLFTLFTSSLYALLVAFIGRVGFGKPLPYGPFLAAGAVSWLLGGWQGWQAYFDFVFGR